MISFKVGFEKIASHNIRSGPGENFWLGRRILQETDFQKETLKTLKSILEARKYDKKTLHQIAALSTISPIHLLRIFEAMDPKISANHISLLFTLKAQTIQKSRSKLEHKVTSQMAFHRAIELQSRIAKNQPAYLKTVLEVSQTLQNIVLEPQFLRSLPREHIKHLLNMLKFHQKTPQIALVNKAMELCMRYNTFEGKDPSQEDSSAFYTQFGELCGDFKALTSRPLTLNVEHKP